MHKPSLLKLFSVLLPLQLAFPILPLSADLPSGFPVTDGLSLYLDGESVQTEGARVVRMMDLSGRGNDAIENMLPGPSRPTLQSSATPSGLDAINFDGLGGYLEVPGNESLFDGRERTTLVVFRARAFGVGRIVNSAYSSLDPENPDANPHYSVGSMFANPGVLRIQNRTLTGGARSVSTQSGSVQLEEFHVGASVWLDSGDSVVTVRNAADQRYASQTDGANAIPTGHIWTRIGANAATGNPTPQDFFNGDVAAAMVYNRALTPDELLQMEQHLRQVYLTGELPPSEAVNLPVGDGLVLHLNAGNVQLDGGEVVLATDLSGFGNDAIGYVHGDIAPRPAPLVSSLTTPTGRGAVRFDGESQYLEVPGNSTDFDGAGKTTLVVFRANELGIGRMVNSAYSSLNPFDPFSPAHYSVHSMFARPGGDLRIQNRTETGGSVALSTESGIIDTESFFIGGNIWLPSGEHLVVVRNPDNERHVSAGDGANAVPTSHIWTWVGANSAAAQPSPTDFFNGDIAAVIVFNRAIDPEELLQVEEFLHARYLQGPALLSFQEWIESFSLPFDQQGPLANPSGDGITNLEKYAFDLNPTEHGRDGLPIIALHEEGGNRFLEVMVVKNPLAVGVTYLPEVSVDLVEWLSGPGHVEILAEDTSMLHARDKTPLGLGEGQARFMRVNIKLEN